MRHAPAVAPEVASRTCRSAPSKPSSSVKKPRTRLVPEASPAHCDAYSPRELHGTAREGRGAGGLGMERVRKGCRGWWCARLSLACCEAHLDPGGQLTRRSLQGRSWLGGAAGRAAARRHVSVPLPQPRCDHAHAPHVVPQPAKHARPKELSRRCGVLHCTSGGAGAGAGAGEVRRCREARAPQQGLALWYTTGQGQAGRQTYTHTPPPLSTHA